MCAVRKISPPKKEPTMPMTMSPTTPRPPPTTADASQPAMRPTTNQIRRVSPLMISSERPTCVRTVAEGRPLRHNKRRGSHLERREQQAVLRRRIKSGRLRLQQIHGPGSRGGRAVRGPVGDVPLCPALKSPEAKPEYQSHAHRCC